MAGTLRLSPAKPADLLQQLDLARPPGLVEPRFRGAVDAQDGVPALAGHGLDPVRLAGGRLRTEVDVHRAIGVDDEVLVLAADAGELLIRLQHRADLVVVDDHRPEVLDRNVGRQVQPVALAAVEGDALRVHAGPGVLRALADHLLFHGRRDAGGEEVVHDVAVEVHDPRLTFEPVAAEERQTPGAVLVVEIFLLPDPEGHGARGGVAYQRRLGEDLLQAVVRRERFALLDADRGIEPQPDRIERLARLLLHHLVQEFPEGIVGRRHRAEVPAGYVDERHGRRIGGIGQTIDPRVLLHEVDTGFRVAIHHEAAPRGPQAECRRLHDEVAVGNLATVAGRQDQELAASALVGPGESDVDHPAVPHVVERPQDLGRSLQHHRPVAQVDPHPAVGGLGIGRQEDGPRVHAVCEDRHRRVGRPQLEDFAAVVGLAHRRNRQQIRLHRPLEVQVVVQFFDRGLIREAGEELERAQPGLDSVRHRDSRRRRRRHLHRGWRGRPRGGGNTHDQRRNERRPGRRDWIRRASSFACHHALLLFSRVRSLSALKPLHALDQRMPAEDGREAEPVHLQVAVIVVVDRRQVAERDLEVVVDVVAERVAEREVVQL